MTTSSDGVDTPTDDDDGDDATLSAESLAPLCDCDDDDDETAAREEDDEAMLAEADESAGATITPWMGPTKS